MKKILELKLKILARLIIKKYQPQVIGITGSLGKTSAKEAIALILEQKFSVRASAKNYNNEIGVPLTIIGAEAPGRSLFGWSAVFLKAYGLLIKTNKDYPDFLVLEMGVDHPGDMEYLTQIVKPQIGVETSVSFSHIAYFGSLDNIKLEKQVLIEKLDNKGLAVLNYDNELTRSMAALSRAKTLSYGLEDGADLCAQEINYHFDESSVSGLNFKMNYQGSIVPVFLKNALGRPAIYAALAGAAVGLNYGFNLIEISQILANFHLPAGRLNLLAGVNGSHIIDDSYNSSPESAKEALKVLASIKTDSLGQRWAILGDMLELGDYAEEAHSLVGLEAAASQLDHLLVVGPRSLALARAAESAGLDKERIQQFDSALAAGRFAKDQLQTGDIVLIKGSQGMRLEKAVKELMAHPDNAQQLLVRQGGSWQK